MMSKFKCLKNSSQPGWASCPNVDQKIQLEAREIRTNSWYDDHYTSSQEESLM